MTWIAIPTDVSASNGSCFVTVMLTDGTQKIPVNLHDVTPGNIADLCRTAIARLDDADKAAAALKLMIGQTIDLTVAPVDPPQPSVDAAFKDSLGMLRSLQVWTQMGVIANDDPRIAVSLKAVQDGLKDSYLRLV